MSNNQNRPLFRGIETTAEVVYVPDEEEPENRRLYAAARFIGGWSLGLLSIVAILSGIHAIFGAGGLYVFGILAAITGILFWIAYKGFVNVIITLIVLGFGATILSELYKAIFH